MSSSTTYQFVLRGRPSSRLLRPLIDDFDVDTSVEGVTQLVGDVNDPAHLHGVMAHLTSVNVEVISFAPHVRHAPDADHTTKGTPS